jgi:hypothetical protein
MAPVSTDTILHGGGPDGGRVAAAREEESARSRPSTGARRASRPQARARREEPPEGTLSVSKAEAETWRWTDGQRAVGEIMERAFLSDFEVLKGTWTCSSGT